jgi:integrase
MTPRLQVALDSISNTLAPDALLFGFAGREVKKGSDALKRIRNKARVGFRFHDLRHTFATRLQAATTNPAIVRDMLGHAPRTSTDLYLHPPLAECREAIMKMAEQTTAGLQAASRVN